MNASKEDLVGDFEDAPTLSESGFHILANPYNHQAMRPDSAVLVLDCIDGYLLQQLSLVARMKNWPLLVAGAGAMDSTKPEAHFIVPCPSGSLSVARSILTGPIPEMNAYSGMPLSRISALTQLVQQVHHIDYRRQCPSREKSEHEMMDILNGGLVNRLRNEPGVSARLSQFEWKKRPRAEALLSVTTPAFSVEERVMLQFEYG